MRRTFQMCSITAVWLPSAHSAQGIDRVGASDIRAAAQLTTLNDSRGVAFRLSNDGNAQYILNVDSGRAI